MALKGEKGRKETKRGGWREKVSKGERGKKGVRGWRGERVA